MKEAAKLGWVATAIGALPALLDAMARHPLATGALMMFMYIIARKQP